MSTSNTKNSQVYSFGKENFSAFQPIDVKPVFGRNWVTNGLNNATFKIYKDAYDDSPTNASIINAYVSYIFAEGLIDKKGTNIDKYISQEDTQLMINDLKIYGGFSAQVIWNSNPTDRKPLRVEYMPIYKLGVNYDHEKMKVDGYWFSYDWNNRARYKPQRYPIFSGSYVGNPLEIIYVRRPTSEPFFPIPDYLAGINWARMEGEIANAGFNYFKNTLSELTVINVNNGFIDDEDLAKQKADKMREDVCGSDKSGKVLVRFNDTVEDSLVIDRIAPSEMSQHNVFYSEEAERKLIVAHSAPPILFAGSNGGTGFSSNADEREIAIKDLYRRNINPFRLTFLNGLYEVFKLIDSNIILDFKDFDSEEKLDTVDSDVIQLQPSTDTTILTGAPQLDEKTLEAQANLKGSVGGVQALLEIQASYAAGTTTYDSAIAMLDMIFGYNKEQAVKLLGSPEKTENTNDTTT